MKGALDRVCNLVLLNKVGVGDSDSIVPLALSKALLWGKSKRGHPQLTR